MQNGTDLPNRIFFTGVPGSRWSGIAQTIENLNGFNTSDRTSEREYLHHQYSGHKGAYFGRGMELDSNLNTKNIDSAHLTHDGTRLIKSHDWAYVLYEIKQLYPNDWIMLVYRPNMSSYTWWHEAGGFDIKYPNYTWYKNSSTMLGEIIKQNSHILKFAQKYDLKWDYFTAKWISQTFGQHVDTVKTTSDILVTILK
jgi:hypothetical protein